MLKIIQDALGEGTSFEETWKASRQDTCERSFPERLLEKLEKHRNDALAQLLPTAALEFLEFPIKEINIVCARPPKIGEHITITSKATPEKYGTLIWEYYAMAGEDAIAHGHTKHQACVVGEVSMHIKGHLYRNDKE
tara:strand:+ start:502 stop:912 length:411 start_codon:yes stop_codon:yes gene_type:complete